MATILVGTSGYAYKDWVGPVYPQGCAAKDYLSHYQELFCFCELNFSYYKQPDVRTMERLVHTTSDSFRFSIKGHRSLTHERSQRPEEAAQEFLRGIAPLRESGKLGSVVLQFPFSFHYTPAERSWLGRLCDLFAGYPLAIEFRNRQWQRESVLDGLLRRDIAFVNVDGPLLPGLPMPSAHAVPSHGYVRFHGRNAANWWNGDNASRYDYLYSEDELYEWLPRIQEMAESARTVMILFNNHWRGQAVQNALQMRKILEAESSGG
jgi:uncharacterized protein YecE (DUF72 family)